jgi:hypothetical protein
MSLEDLLKDEPKSAKQCRFAPWLESLSEDDRNAILRAFDERTTTISHIVRVLQGYGCPSSATSIRTHAKNECVACKR